MLTACGRPQGGGVDPRAAELAAGRKINAA